MQNLLVSVVRLTAAVTLFGLEQIQRTARALGSGQDLSATFDRFQGVLDQMTDTLATRMDRDKKDTLESVTDVSEGVVQRAMDSINVIDPRQVLRATNDLVRKTSNAMSDWMAKTEPSSDDDEPKPAAEVLG